MWLKHHSWQQLFCTESLQVKICVATIVMFSGPPCGNAASASCTSSLCPVDSTVFCL